MRDAVKSSLKIGLVVLVVAGLAMSGLALAQTPGDEEPADPPAVTEEDNGARPSGRFHARHFRGGDDVIGAVVDATGLTPEEIRAELDADKTLAQIATENGSTGDVIVSAVMNEVNEHLAAAVEEGRLTQEEADEKLADMEVRVTDIVNGDAEFPGPRRGAGPRGMKGPRGAHAEELADVLGLTVEELGDALAGGQTLAEVAAAQGVSVDDLVAAQLTRIEEHLAGAVEDGRLTQVEADEKLTDAEQRIREAIENGEGLRFGHHGRRGPGGEGFGPRGGEGFGPRGGEGFGPRGGFGPGPGTGDAPAEDAAIDA